MWWLGIVVYIIIGVVVVDKIDEKLSFNENDVLDMLICGILGAFWPIALACLFLFD